MHFSFEETKLWRNVFASGEYSEEKRRIRQSYCSFWKRTCELAKFIASDLPGLTLHDERHFHALWQRADQIAGDGYFLNPIELFAFGGGILLHDTGLTLSTYPGGLNELRQTLEWRDAAALIEPTAEETAARTTTQMAKDGFLSTDAEIQFEVLRQLHGSRAEELADLALVLPDSSDSLHLIEDESLRRHLGPTIGQIAASHHWDLHILERKLPHEIGAVGGFPPDWTIRPIVLACLLRCADAAQVDQQRAPDFSYALLRGNRGSEKHWRAQNRLAQPFVTGDALTYTSTRVFGRDDAQAWWLAADALLVAHKELESCNRLLADLRAKPFAIRAVRDATTPDRLQTHIRVNGWEPVSVGTTISNPRAVIQMLGGELLYEEKGLAVPIRELVQNAADAVRARGALEGTETSYRGWVEVRIEDAGDDLHKWITVEDNGVGMPQRVLTGPLIDFGRSLWRSALVKEMLPGFASKRIEQIGRYGIGFYSTMIVSDYVTVSSRPYNAGLESIATVHFPKGLLDHGVLVKGSNEPMGTSICTRVRLKVKKDVVEQFLSVETSDRHEPQEAASGQLLSLEDRLEILCVALDCDVYSRFEMTERILAHRSDWQVTEPKVWLDRLFLPSFRSSWRFDRAIEVAARTLRQITEGNACRGRAAISFLNNPSLELEVVQAFNKSRPSIYGGGRISGMIGFLESESTGPRRARLKYRASPQALVRWASEQATLLAQSNLTPDEAHYAAINVASFGGSVAPIANLFINGKLQNICELTRILFAGNKIVVPLHKYHPRRHPEDRIGNLSFNLGDFLSIPIELMQISKEVAYLGESLNNNVIGDDYYLIEPLGVKEESTVVGCLRSRLKELKYSMAVNVYEDFDFWVYTGPDFNNRSIKAGMRLVQRAALISATKL